MGEEVTKLPEHVTFAQVMDRWTTQRGYPIVTVVRNYQEGSAIVKQVAFSYDNLVMQQQSNLWYVSLACMNKTEDPFNPRKFWLLPNQEEFQLRNISEPTTTDNGNGSSWILCNVNGTGYYRVHYDESNWKVLTRDIEENHEMFSSETRATLIDDVFALSALGYTKYEIAFNFIKYMQMKERHYAPWGVFALHVNKLNIALYETSIFSDLQEYLQNFVSPLYEEAELKLVEGSPLTFVAVQLACLLEHPKCLDWAKRNFPKQLENSTNSIETIPEYLRSTLYCTIAKQGGKDEWNYISRKAKLAKGGTGDERKNLLSAFGCFQLPRILRTVLNDILIGEEFNDDEVRIILESFATQPVATRIAYEFIRENWADIVKRFIERRSVMKYFIVAAINGLSSEQDLQDLHLFWEDNYESMKMVGYVSTILEAKATFTASWIRNSTLAIEKWLRDNQKST